MAIKSNLVVDQGSNFFVIITITDTSGNLVDLTGFTASAQMRKHFTSATAISFTCETGGANGTISLALTSEETTAITAGRYVYDVEVTTATDVVSRVVEGIVTVTPNVTR